MTLDACPSDPEDGNVPEEEEIPEMRVSESDGSDESDECEPEEISFAELRDEIVAAGSESRRGARRSFEMLRHFGGVLDAMSATVNDLHRSVRTRDASAPASAADEVPGRDAAMGLIELADRIERIGAAFERTPQTSFFAFLWPGARRALAPWREDRATLADSFSILRTHVDGMLKQLGLERLNVVGQIFDPARMNAVEAVSDPGHPNHTVLADLLPGWKHAPTGQILRPAQVRVSRT